jgi:hypothetical protein
MLVAGAVAEASQRRVLWRGGVEMPTLRASAIKDVRRP